MVHFGGLHNYPGHAPGVWQRRTCTLHTEPRTFSPRGLCADHQLSFLSGGPLDANPLCWAISSCGVCRCRTRKSEGAVANVSSRTRNRATVFSFGVFFFGQKGATVEEFHRTSSVAQLQPVLLKRCGLVVWLYLYFHLFIKNLSSS